MESLAKLLVVDHDEKSRAEKIRVLESAGWSVSAAASGDEALRDYDIASCEVVILDTNARQTDGPTLCQLIKQRNPTVPILRTARNGLDLAETNSDSQINGYLIEPFEPLELLSFVRSLLRLNKMRVALHDAEARLQLAQDAGGLTVFDWNLVTGRAIWSEKFAELFQLPANAADEPFNPEIIARHVHPDDRVGLSEYYKSAVSGSGQFERDFRVVSSDGAVHWITARGKLIKDSLGRLERILCLNLDITERKHSDLRNAQLAAIVASSIDAIVSVDFSDTILTWNNGAEQLFDYKAQEVLGRKTDFLVPPEHLAERQTIMRQLMKGEAIEYQTQRRRKDGQTIDVWIRGAPVPGLGGSLVGGSLIIRDISAQTQREAHIRFLMRELTHRSKNLLAVIQAMARQSLSLLSSPEEFVARFSERLSGLAGSHDLLSSDDWAGASLVQLIRSQLQHYNDLFGTRIHLEGPDLILRPEAAQNIGIALHELSTNAAKFGALSDSDGTVTVSWKIVTDAQQGRRMQMRWEEHSGPPVAPPGHKGFGHMVMDRITGQALGGRSQAQFEPGGVCWVLDVPMSSVVREPVHEATVPHV